MSKTKSKFLSILFIILSAPNVSFSSENNATDMDSNGSILIAWQQDSLFGTEVVSLTKPFGSPWESPATLSLSLIAYKPVVAVQANGTDMMSVAIWQEFAGFTSQIYGAIRPSLAGPWSSSVLLSNGTEDVFGEPELKLQVNGDIVATWTSIISFDPKLRVATATVSSGTWSSPITLAP